MGLENDYYLKKKKKLQGKLVAKVFLGDYALWYNREVGRLVGSGCFMDFF
jgi:hypothetical protein